MQTNVVLYVSSLSRSKLSREITCLQLKRTFIKITQSDNTAEKKKSYCGSGTVFEKCLTLTSDVFKERRDPPRGVSGINFPHFL